jgi:eukaryotic-like serine/threonine-protein kinase
VTGGFRVAAPDGWRRLPAAGESLRLTAPGGTPVLRIGAWTPSDGDVVAALTAGEPDTGLAAYRRIRIEPLAGPSGGLWEYTYTDPVTGPMRVLERITGGGGHTYRIEWRAPLAQWPAGLPVLDAVLDSFGPQPGA